MQPELLSSPTKLRLIVDLIYNIAVVFGKEHKRITGLIWAPNEDKNKINDQIHDSCADFL